MTDGKGIETASKDTATLSMADISYVIIHSHSNYQSNNPGARILLFVR